MIKLFIVALELFELLVIPVPSLSARCSWIGWVTRFIGMGPLASLKAIIVIRGFTLISVARAFIPIVIHSIVRVACRVRTVRISTIVVFLSSRFLIIVSSISFLRPMAEVWVPVTGMVGVFFVAIATLIAVGRLISKRIIR